MQNISREASQRGKYLQSQSVRLFLFSVIVNMSMVFWNVIGLKLNTYFLDQVHRYTRTNRPDVTAIVSTVLIGKASVYCMRRAVWHNRNATFSYQEFSCFSLDRKSVIFPEVAWFSSAPQVNSERVAYLKICFSSLLTHFPLYIIHNHLPYFIQSNTLLTSPIDIEL
jgi:hypothetical protein